MVEWLSREKVLQRRGGRARRSARAENGVEEKGALRRARSDAPYPLRMIFSSPSRWADSSVGPNLLIPLGAGRIGLRIESHPLVDRGQVPAGQMGQAFRVR